MKRSTRFLLSIASGIMLSLAWLGFPGWILFVAFLPLLLLDDFFNKESARFTSVSFWGHAWLAFIIWNAFTTWWVMHATPVGAVLVVFLNSFMMSVLLWLAHLIRRQSHNRLGYLALVVFWITFEFLHFHWQIEWPWLTLGNGFANNIKMIQWYEYTGILGGSLWVLIVNILIFKGLKIFAEKQPFSQILTPLVFLLIFVFVPMFISLYRYNTYAEIPIPRKVLVIQPNIDPYAEAHDEGAMNDKLWKFLRLVEKNTTADIDYIVGPETVFEQNWNEQELSSYPSLLRLKNLIQPNGKASLIIGASTFKIYSGSEIGSGTMRTSRDGMKYDVYNTAIFMDSTTKFQVYHKSILVSGVEKMPFRKYLKFVDKLIINLGGTTGSLGKQNEPTNFIAHNGDRIAPVICYESVFGGYLSRFVKKGAGLIFIITNDGWWKNSPGFRQHFSFARLRAIETRRSIVRSANTGISGLINQRGDIVYQSKWWTDEAFTGTVNVNNKLTFYVKYGDYIARISAFMAVLLLLKLISAWIMGKKNPHQF